MPRFPRHLTLSVLAFLPFDVQAQLEPPSTGGYAALDLALRRLGHHKRVLMVAAHPDDEDTELLTILVRGEGAEAAYLSLTRGEGGQNLIGEELGEALGLLRTEELLAARRIDGAGQFFTRAYDFGFSKNLDDTWAHWPRDSILKDVVRIIRRFRPQIVVSIFTGLARDGHGQHQAAGWAAREAFRLAGDSTVFPELLTEEGLPVHAPLKLYRSTRFDSVATTLMLDGGALDPAVGQSFHQMAMRGRSLHRSQDMGQLQRIGPSATRLQLFTDLTGASGGGLWDGVETTLAGAAGMESLAPDARARIRSLLQRYVARVDSARALVAIPLRAELRRLLGRAADDLAAVRRQLHATAPPRNSPHVPAAPLEEEFRRLALARLRGLDLVYDGVIGDERVFPGQRVPVTASVWNAGDSAVPVRLCLEATRVGWRFAGADLSRATRLGACLAYGGDDAPWSQGGDPGMPLPRGRLAVAQLDATVPESEDYTTPYFLRFPRVGDLYTWGADDRPSWGLPFQAPLLAGGLVVDSELADVREITFRGNDQATGEFRRPVVVVPRVSVRLDPELEIWPQSRSGPRTFTVTLTHGAGDTTAGQVLLRMPPGWRAPPPQRFTLTREDERATFRFTVRAPAGARAGVYRVSAVAVDIRGRAFDVGMTSMDHDHVRARTWSRQATADVRVVDLTLPRLRRIAYLRGAADRVPEALTTIGLPVDVVSGAVLSRDLSRYDVIIIGPRAFETDAGLAAGNERLLAYARAGGTVLVQYQQYGYFLGGFAPYPLTVGSRSPGTPGAATTVARRDSTRGTSPALFGGHDRVTDEGAPVTMLRPRSPVFTYPNRIGASDWEGWVQERGLYFARTWDPAWQPVLEMHDPGEAPLQGGLLVARLGRGTYVYCGLSFFRQLPAGVPGAWRLFLNLLALGEQRPSRPPPPAPVDSPKVERE